MIKLGLIGYPLGHSLSPKIHDAALKSCGLDGSYSLFPIHADNKQGLKDLLARVRNGEITGLNVTIPHKQNVIELLDELMPTAKAIGAVNTIYLRENRLIGDNTDATGFLADLRKFLTTETHTCPGGRCQGRHGESKALVLGAGGSARAVVYALLNDGWEVNIVARRFEQARQLADSFINYQLPVTAFSLTTMEANLQHLHRTQVQVSLISSLSLIINTIPVGMTPNIDESPWPKNLPFPPRAAVYDLVYNPQETKLVQDARRQGLQATTGLGMLIEQAALAFEIWTCQNPSREIMRASVEQSLVSNH